MAGNGEKKLAWKIIGVLISVLLLFTSVGVGYIINELRDAAAERSNIKSDVARIEERIIAIQKGTGDRVEQATKDREDIGQLKVEMGQVKTRLDMER